MSDNLPKPYSTSGILIYLSVAVAGVLVGVAMFWVMGAGSVSTPKTPEPAAAAATAPAPAHSQDVEPKPASANTLVLADFNDRSGVFSEWNSFTPDPSGQCREEVAAGAGPDGSAAWKIKCGISTPGSYGGTWMGLQLIDGSAYNMLRFKARTDRAELRFGVELKLKPGGKRIVSKKIIVKATPEWRTIEIPLTEFSLPNLKDIDHFVINFEQSTTGPVDATLWMDDLELVKQ